jgi:hypothetical protein
MPAWYARQDRDRDQDCVGVWGLPFESLEQKPGALSTCFHRPAMVNAHARPAARAAKKRDGGMLQNFWVLAGPSSLRALEPGRGAAALSN